MHRLLEPYAKIVDFLGNALGENYEIALHDLTENDGAIVAISNNHFSKREVGAKMSNLSRHYIEDKVYEKQDYVNNYKTVGADGKLMRSSSYFVREDGRKEPVGMLCINVDISDYEYLDTTLKKMLGIKEDADVEYKIDNPVEVLSTSLDQMVDQYVKTCLEEMGLPGYFAAKRLKVDEKIKVVEFLNDRGTFQIKGAITLVANRLGVSEPTVYRYLKKAS